MPETTSTVTEMGEPDQEKSLSSEDEDWSEELYREKEEQVTTGRGNDQVEIDVSQLPPKTNSHKFGMYAMFVFLLASVVAISTAFAFTVREKDRFERDLSARNKEIERLKAKVEHANIEIATYKSEAESKDQEIARWEETYEKIWKRHEEEFQIYQSTIPEWGVPSAEQQAQPYVPENYECTQHPLESEEVPTNVAETQYEETQYAREIVDVHVPIFKHRHVPMVTVSEKLVDIPMIEEVRVQKFVEVPQIEIVQKVIEIPVIEEVIVPVVIPVIQKDDAEKERVEVEVPVEVIVDVHVPIEREEIVHVPKVEQKTVEEIIEVPTVVVQEQIVQIPVAQRKETQNIQYVRKKSE